MNTSAKSWTLRTAIDSDLVRWWGLYTHDPAYRDHPYWYPELFLKEIVRRVDAGEIPHPLPDDVALLLMEVTVE